MTPSPTSTCTTRAPAATPPGLIARRVFLRRLRRDDGSRRRIERPAHAGGMEDQGRVAFQRERDELLQDLAAESGRRLLLHGWSILLAPFELELPTFLAGRERPGDGHAACQRMERAILHGVCRQLIERHAEILHRRRRQQERRAL